MSKYILKNLLNLSLVVGVCVGGFCPLYQRSIDINDDGIIDICDVQQLVSAIISNNVSTLPDINKDGSIQWHNKSELRQSKNGKNRSI